MMVGVCVCTHMCVCVCMCLHVCVPVFASVSFHINSPNGLNHDPAKIDEI